MNDSSLPQANESERSFSRWNAIVGLVGVNALWGLSFPMMKTVHTQIDSHFGVHADSASDALRVASSSWVIGLRFLFAMTMLFICYRQLVRRTTRQEWIAGAWIALFFYLGAVLQVIGLATITASRSGFLTSLTSVFTPLFAALIWKRSPTWLAWIGAFVALLGVAILTEMIGLKNGSLNLTVDAWTIGDTLTTIGAAFFTGQVMLVDYFSRRGLNSTAFTPGMFAVCTILSLLTFLVLAPWVPESPQGGWTSLLMTPSFVGVLLFLGVFCSLFSFLGMNTFQPYVTAVQASIIYGLEPVFASSWALFVPGWIAALTGLIAENEHWTWSLVVGGAVILLANIIALWPVKERTR